MTRLVLWRHGRTQWNAEHRVQGQTDVLLDPTGQEQAAVAATRLARLKPDQIVSSDLRRAADTAAALAQVTGLPVKSDPRLRERSFGDWQGHTLVEVEQLWPEEFARWRTGVPTVGAGVEAIEDIVARMGEALREIAERAESGTVVVTGHGGSIRYGLASLLGWTESIVRTLGPLGNCHWCEVRYSTQRGWQLFGYNVG